MQNQNAHHKIKRGKFHQILAEFGHELIISPTDKKIQSFRDAVQLGPRLNQQIFAYRPSSDHFIICHTAQI